MPSHAERPALEVAVGSAGWLLSVFLLFLRLSLGSSSILVEDSVASCEELLVRSVKFCGPCSHAELWLLIGAALFVWVFVEEGRSLEGIGLTDSPNSRLCKLD